MDIDFDEPPLRTSNATSGVENQDQTKRNKPATRGFEAFWSGLDRSEKATSAAIEFAKKYSIRLNTELKKADRYLFSQLKRALRLMIAAPKESKSIAFQIIIVAFIAFLPWISQASVSRNEQIAVKKFYETNDPIQQGQIAMNLNQYLPQGLYADPDVVVLSQITKENNTFTLAEQLAVNSGDTTGPERQSPTYEVKQGETITQIAEKFQLHVGTILAANSLNPVEGKKLKSGMVLNIPSTDTDTSDEWLVAINRAAKEEADRKAAEAAAAAKKKAAAKRVASAATGVTRSTGSYSSGSVTVIGTSYDQCVIWARANSGIQIHGYAGNIEATQSEPRVGGIALDRFFGHASVVVGVTGDSIVVHEANWIRGKITERVVSKAAIRGYVY